MLKDPHILCVCFFFFFFPVLFKMADLDFKYSLGFITHVPHDTQALHIHATRTHTSLHMHHPYKLLQLETSAPDTNS